jgi:hypothetical protein
MLRSRRQVVSGCGDTAGNTEQDGQEKQYRFESEADQLIHDHYYQRLGRMEKCAGWTGDTVIRALYTRRNTPY